MKRLQKLKQQSAGFTIIELLIATLVFGTVLMVVTVGILQITRAYYKGLTEASTQDTARSVMDQITQAIQFSGGVVTETPTVIAGQKAAFCVGNQQYSYRLGYEVNDAPQTDPLHTQTYHALTVRDLAGCTSSSTPEDLDSAAISGRELLGPDMRLTSLVVKSVNGNPDVFRVSIRIVHGDNDLLQNPTASNAKCQNFSAGTQFCAIADLSSVVVKRVQ